MIKQNLIDLTPQEKQLLSQFPKQNNLWDCIQKISNQIWNDLFLGDTNYKKAWKLFARANKLQELLDEKIYKLFDSQERLLAIRETMQEMDFAYPLADGSIWRRISWDVIDFDNELTDSIARLPDMIKSFYEDRLVYLRSQEWKKTCEELWFEEDVLSKLTVPKFTRLDCVLWVDGKIRIVEIEPSPAWIWELLWTRDVNNLLIQKYNNTEWVVAPYLRALQDYSDSKIVAYPNPSLSWYFPSTRYLYESLQKDMKNIELTYDEIDFSFEEDGLYYVWEKVDLLLNYFVPKANIPSQSTDNLFYQNVQKYYREWKLSMYPQPCFWLDDKSFLGLLCDSPELFPNSSELIPYLPKTSVFSWDELIEFPCLLKRAVSTDEFKDIYEFNTIDELTDDIRNIVKDDSENRIYQEKIIWKRFPIVSIGSTSDDLREDLMWARIELQLFFDDTSWFLGDILITLSKSDTIIGSTKTWVMIPWNLSYKI